MIVESYKPPNELRPLFSSMEPFDDDGPTYSKAQVKKQSAFLSFDCIKDISFVCVCQNQVPFTSGSYSSLKIVI